MFRGNRCYCILCAIVGLALAWLLFGARPQVVQAQAPKGPVSFINDVAPILKDNCYACHETKMKRGKFDMTTYAQFRQGGKRKDPVKPGKPNDSLLIKLMTSTSKGRMPPLDSGEPVANDKIAIIAKWIEEGARLDKDVGPQADLLRELLIRWQPPRPDVAYNFPVTINALIFSPDNKKLLVGGKFEVTSWDLATGKLEKRLWTRAERVHGLAFLPDGKLVLAGDRPGQEGLLNVYDLSGNSALEKGTLFLDGVKDPTVLAKTLLKLEDSLIALGVSPDGKKIATGGWDRLVRVMDIGDGLDKARLAETINSHKDVVLGVAFSPDGKYLGTSSRDGTAKVWDLAGRKNITTFADHRDYVHAVVFSPDGKFGISGGKDKNVFFWPALVSEKTPGKLIKDGEATHAKAVQRLAIHADARKALLASGSSDTTVKLWDAGTGTPIKTLTGLNDWVHALAFSPDGSMLAAGSFTGQVRVWQISDGMLVKDFIAAPGYVPPKSAAK